MGATVKSYDYIIIGAGCAGLSLAMRMTNDVFFLDKRILIIEKSPKNLNDRTWCFWEEPTSDFQIESGLNYFDAIVHHEWKELWLKHPNGDINLDIAPFSYKLIRGIDFYKFCLDTISKAKNIEILYAQISEVLPNDGLIKTDDETYFAQQIFSSVLLKEPVLQPHQLYLLQHFKGWWIETETDFFTPEHADLMNFKTSQKFGCAFMYVLPISKRRALVEYTLFSEKELEKNDYENGLKTFIEEELQLLSYAITDIEQGVIPMTDFKFQQQQGKVFFIGTAGGFTKASTGYTFQFIQKSSEAIIKKLKNNLPLIISPSKKFMWYDSIFLRVLHERKLLGSDIFFYLFKKNKADSVLRFLNNDTKFLEEVKIMKSTRMLFFLQAAWSTIFKRKQIPTEWGLKD